MTRPLLMTERLDIALRFLGRRIDRLTDEELDAVAAQAIPDCPAEFRGDVIRFVRNESAQNKNLREELMMRRPQREHDAPMRVVIPFQAFMSHKEMTALIDFFHGIDRDDIGEMISESAMVAP